MAIGWIQIEYSFRTAARLNQNRLKIENSEFRGFFHLETPQKGQKPWFFVIFRDFLHEKVPLQGLSHKNHET